MKDLPQKMPIHVAIIFSDRVRLHGEGAQLKPKLAAAGCGDRYFVDEQGYSAIRFNPGGDNAKNISLLTILFLLNDMGVPFAEDHTQLWSPAEFMRELQRQFMLKKPFTSVGGPFKEYNDWIYKTHEPLVYANPEGA